MPKYRVSDPTTGVTLELEGDSPPTEAELVEIFNQYQKPAAPAQPRLAAPEAAIPSRRLPAIGDVGDRATGFRQQVEETGMTPQERQAAVRGFAGFTGSLLAGPILGGLVRGAGTAFPVLQRFTTPLATSLETGGFRTGMPATTSRATRALVSGAGGAGAAGGGALIVEPETAPEAAAVGFVLPQILPPVAKVLAKGGGAVVDALAGRTADVRANELIRTAANNEVNALRQAMAANPDMPASRAAADLNLPVLQALLARAEQRDPQQVVNAFRKRESQDIVNQLTRIAGGATAETARAAREGAKETLGAITAPIREQELKAAAATGRIVPKLQTIAADARQAVTDAVDRVRRFTGAISSAEEWAKNWVASGGAKAAGQPRVPAKFTFPGELAETAERRAGEAAKESLRLGKKARGAEGMLAAMEAEGLTPIANQSLTGQLNGLLRSPEIGTNREASTAIRRIVDMINDWSNENGIVDPFALYAIRKNGVAGVIRELNPNMDAKAQSKFAAQVLSDIKPVIDDAIVKAGGKNWPAYLDSFEQGMSSIKGMELADQIRKLYAKGTPESKQQIIDLVRGESPDVVEDLFGSGRYQISKEMAKDMPFLTKLADTLDLDRKAVEQAAAGRAALIEAEKKGSARVRFPFFTRASTAVNEVVAGLEQRMKAETLDVLIRAAQSGREFNRVLDQIPARDKNAFLKQFKDAESWNKFAGQVAQAAQVQATSRAAKDYQEAPVMMNSLAPVSVNQLRTQ